ncbi:hypothetical protein ACHMW5_08430 (plasmid) [Azospirillum melinis]|uniref:hypothetical protein n=1 Tax=Azospirillum melinis TaxID=328839 RepID=UPI003756EB0C
MMMTTAQKDSDPVFNLARTLDRTIEQAARESDTVAAAHALALLRNEILQRAETLLASEKKDPRSIFLYPLE